MWIKLSEKQKRKNWQNIGYRIEGKLKNYYKIWVKKWSKISWEGGRKGCKFAEELKVAKGYISKFYNKIQEKQKKMNARQLSTFLNQISEIKCRKSKDSAKFLTLVITSCWWISFIFPFTNRFSQLWFLGIFSTHN